MLLTFNIYHFDMIKEFFKEEGRDVDFFVRGDKIHNAYIKTNDAYRLAISIKDISDTDEVLNFKLGNIKEHKALAKKINNNAYANVSRLSPELKDKIMEACPQLVYVTGDVSLSKEQADKLMKKSIKAFGDLLRLNEEDKNSPQYKKLYSRASFIVDNINNYTKLTEVLNSQVKVTNGLQFIYQDFKKEFNEQNISLLMIAMFSEWSYSSSYNLNNSGYNREKYYVDIFIRNMKANKDKVSPFFNSNVWEGEDNLFAEVYKQLYIDFIKMSYKGLESGNVGDVFKKEILKIFEKIIDGTESKDNFYKTFNNKGFEDNFNTIFNILEDNKSVHDFFISNKLIEKKEISLKNIESEMFIESNEPYQDLFTISSKTFIESFPLNFIEVKYFKNQNPFKENDLSKFYLKVMGHVKDIFELSTNVNVKNCALTEDNLIMVLCSNEEIDKDKLKKLFIELIKVYNKYDTISQYATHHEMEMQKIVMNFDLNESNEKSQLNNNKRSRVIKF